MQGCLSGSHYLHTHASLIPTYKLQRLGQPACPLTADVASGQLQALQLLTLEQSPIRQACNKLITLQQRHTATVMRYPLAD